jgi:FMN phosphatase YigB (HAD superfamily)
MNRPLVITDCDEVLLHMVRHFAQWLGERHDIELELGANPFQNVRYRASAELLPDEEKWRYLNLFFDTEMSSQTLIEGSAAAILELQRDADVVVLTNLTDNFNAARKLQLRDHGIEVPVFTNQGPKGPAIRRIVDEYAPSRAVFIDDIAQHIASAAESAPDISRLHFCGESSVAPHIPCAHRAGHAHARIDTWAEALPWLLETLHGIDHEH